MKQPVPESKARRKYDRAFKEEAVQSWLASGKPASVIAGELGLNPNSLYNWRKAFGPAEAKVEGSAVDLAAEIASLRRELERVRQQRDILKKNLGHHLGSSEQRFERIEAMKTEHPILELCEVLEVSRSGYYDWCERQQTPAARTVEDALLRERIKVSHAQSRESYGSPRIQRDLREDGLRHGRNRIARLMREAGLSGRQTAGYRPVTTDSNHDQPIAPNRLAQAAAPTAPNQQWVADITYIATAEGWLYLAAVMDLYSRRIVGWAMSERIDTTLVLLAYRMATFQRYAPKKVLFHSDRGVQYASGEFRAALGQDGALASMSRKACCYDNAAMESFWSTLKLELVYRRTFATRAQARHEIFDYIEAFYNLRRRHSSLGYLSPADFENRLN